MAAAARSIDDDLTSAKCVQITHIVKKKKKSITRSVEFSMWPFVIFGSSLSARGCVDQQVASLFIFARFSEKQTYKVSVL